MSFSSREAFEASKMNNDLSIGSSSQAIRVDAPVAPEDITHADRRLPPDVMNIVFEYMNSTPLYGPTLFGNLSKPYAAQAELAAFYLVNGDKVTADELVDANPAILNCVVDTTDRYGNRTKVRLFELAALYGSFNIHENEIHNKPFGLVERWMRHLPSEEAAERLKALKLSWSTERMTVVTTAITEFLTDIGNAKATIFNALKVELASSIQKFKRIFTPDPNKVITTEFIFDLQVLDTALDLFEKHIKRLGGRYSDKSDLFAVLGFGFLQDCASMYDKQVFRKGPYYVLERKQMPDSSLNSVGGRPVSLSGLGEDFFLDICGGAGGTAVSRLPTPFGRWRLPLDLCSKLCANKNSSVAMCYATARQSCQESVCNPVAFFNNPAAIAAAGESSQQDLINHPNNSSYCQASSTVLGPPNVECRK